jgi:hypothetical protein
MGWGIIDEKLMTGCHFDVNTTGFPLAFTFPNAADRGVGFL